MFTTGMLESRQERVDLHGVEPHIMDLLLTYAYTSVVHVPKEHLQVKYEPLVHSLMIECMNWFINISKKDILQSSGCE